ncbi:MAG TPA: hypothetical protein VEZ14_03600 [Dehalococcoidia bacterium]|nr:hypothetical protein [Dehalococcoidia bacterium]
MATWLAALRRNLDALLAFSLAWIVIAIYLGPGYFFAFLYLLLSLLIARTALRR